MRKRHGRQIKAGDHLLPKDAIRLRESKGTGFLRKEFDFALGHPTAEKHTDRVRVGVPTLFSLVLPHGFPDSVTSDYVRFQFWDTLQALSTYLRGILTQQSLLAGLGVGDASATAISAALSFCFLSGMSMLGGIIFAFRISIEFGADPKRWRFFADVINDFGLSLTLLAPLAGPLFLIVASAGSICTAVCGVAAGATKVAITQHFVKDKTNSALLSDLHAKEGTQETIVSIMGLFFGSGLAYLVEGSLLIRWVVFISLTTFHIFANYQAVTSLSFATLNEQRASILTRHYCKFNTVLAPVEVSRRELVWRRPVLDSIRIGVPLHSLVCNVETYDWYKRAIAKNPSKRYILNQSNGSINVILHESATSTHILQAFFEANRALTVGLKNAIKESESAFSSFLEGIQQKGWQVDQVMITDEGWRCHWE